MTKLKRIKTLPLGAAHIYIAYVRKYPSPGPNLGQSFEV